MYAIRYADGWIRFELPATATAIVARPAPPPSCEAWRAIRDALRAPLASPPLAAMAPAGGRVCVVVASPSEGSPDRLLVPPLVTTLELAGVAKEEITILIANGLRRPSTPAEKEEQLGTEIVQRYKVIDHDAGDAAWLRDLGVTPGGQPLLLNRRAIDADLLLSTGTVAFDTVVGGWSGGAKTVALGCAGAATLDAVRGGTARAGGQDGERLVDEFLAVASRRARHAFALNALVDAGGGVTAVAAGEPAAVRSVLEPLARAACRSPIDHECNVAILGLGWPYDLNLRLALATTATCLLTEGPVVAAGGTIVVAARLPEGTGASEAELALYAAMEARARGAQWQDTDDPVNAAVLHFLDRYAVVVVGAGDPAIPLALGIGSAATVDDALTRAAERHPEGMRVVVVERASGARLELA